jgi:hypothetical protein
MSGKRYTEEFKVEAVKQGRRSKYAAIWLWAELTGGDWRLAPGMEGENIESTREVFRALGKTIMPKLDPHLRVYGGLLLEKAKRLS